MSDDILNRINKIEKELQDIKSDLSKKAEFIYPAGVYIGTFNICKSRHNVDTGVADRVIIVKEYGSVRTYSTLTGHVVSTSGSTINDIDRLYSNVRRLGFHE